MRTFFVVGGGSAGTSGRVAQSTTPGAVYKSDSGVGYYSCRGHGRARVVSVQLGVGGENGLFRTNRL